MIDARQSMYVHSLFYFILFFKAEEGKIKIMVSPRTACCCSGSMTVNVMHMEMERLETRTWYGSDQNTGAERLVWGHVRVTEFGRCIC